MKRHKATRDRAVGRTLLILLLLGMIRPLYTGWAEAPIGRFVIGVYKPAG